MATSTNEVTRFSIRVLHLQWVTNEGPNQPGTRARHAGMHDLSIIHQEDIAPFPQAR